MAPINQDDIEIKPDGKDGQWKIYPLIYMFFGIIIVCT
jgi:hypothetical protein